MTRRASLLALASVFVLSTLLAGCGAIFGSRYDNFRAYFNAFYNAERAFEEAEEQIVRDDQAIDRTRYIQVLPKPEQRRAGTGSGGPFQEEVIERLGDLLRRYPDTKFTAGSLLLVGKSYFYQGNYEGAKLNLRESIRVAQEEGREREEDEARLWLGRALAANGESEQAGTVLREAIAREGARARWTSQMQLALAQLHVQDERWSEAASALVEGIPRVDEGDLAARAQFLLGQVYEALEQYGQAAGAYDEVRRYRPLYELRYAADLNRVLALGIGASRVNEALTLVRGMLRDDNNFTNLAELEVARARVLTAAGRPAEARAALLTLLYDDEGRNIGQMRGQALYRLGEVYRDGFEDYRSAAAYLDSAATVLRAPVQRRSELTRQALLDVDEEAEVYVGFAEAARLVADYDSLLELGSLDEDAFRARIFAIQEERQLAAAEEVARQERLRNEQGFRNPTAGGFRSPTDTGVPSAAATAGGDFGFLSYLNTTRVLEAYAAFEARWGDRPLRDNWRRREAISLAVAEGDVGEEEFGADFESPEVGLGVDVTDVPRTPEAQTTMRADRAAALYEMGNALFLALGRPDSAVVVYREVIESADERVAERAYYALAEAERALGNGEEADRWYRYVLETYPDSDLADQARERLGLVRAERTDAQPQDTAETAYTLAYARWQDRDYPRAFERMLILNETFPDSDVAPRALLAAGRVYAEWATTGSVGLYDPLPQADTLDLSGLYGQVAERYRGTPYAQRAIALRDALEEGRPVPDTVAIDPDVMSAPDSLALPDLDGADYLPTPADSLSDVTDSDGMEDAGADSVGVDSTAAASQASEEEPPVPGLTPAARTVMPPSPTPAPPAPDDEMLRRPERIRPVEGAVTWVVGTYQQRADAEPQLQRLALDGYQTALLREQRGQLTRFLVVVGTFETPGIAVGARPAAAELVGEGIQPYQVGLGGATIVLHGADLR